MKNAGSLRNHEKKCEKVAKEVPVVEVTVLSISQPEPEINQSQPGNGKVKCGLCDQVQQM